MVLALSAVGFLLAGRPEAALARSCEDICGELAAQNCEKIDSMKCDFYIIGCLAGCSVGQLLKSDS